MKAGPSPAATGSATPSRGRRIVAGLQRFGPIVLALLLVLALSGPTWPGRQSVQELVVFIDITQSMAATDTWLVDERGAQHPVTRLRFAKQHLKRLLPALHCGSRIGLGIFTEHRSFLLIAPVEVCEGYRELQSSIDLIDFRMAWTGNSEVAKGLDAALRIVSAMPTKPALVFVTDGHEAPPVNPRYRPSMHTDRGAVPGLIIGVGGDALVPIPRLDLRGRTVGNWAAKEVLQVDPRSLGRDGSMAGERMTEDADAPAVTVNTGATPGREHLTSLRDDYLKLLADEAGLDYLRLKDDAGLLAAVSTPRFSHVERSAVPLRWPLTLLVLVLLVLLYRPWAVLAAWRKSGLRRRPQPRDVLAASRPAR